MSKNFYIRSFFALIIGILIAKFGCTDLANFVNSSSKLAVANASFMIIAVLWLFLSYFLKLEILAVVSFLTLFLVVLI